MIIVKGRELLIPENERYIGTNYDTGMENRVFRIPRLSQSGTDLSDLKFNVNLIFNSEPLDIAELQKNVDDDYIYLTWTVTAAQVAVTGTVFVCVTGNDTNDTVKWSSFMAPFYTEKSLREDVESEYKKVIAKVNQEIVDRENADAALQSAVSAEANARTEADAALQSAVSAEANARTEADASLQTQINQMVAPKGEAPSAAEVENARIGADGAVNSTLGVAIRTQVTGLKNEIKSLYDLTYLPFLDLTQGGLNSDGSDQSDTENRRVRSGYIPVNGWDFFTLNKASNVRWAAYYFDATYTLLGSTSWAYTGYVAIPESYTPKYMRLVFGNSANTAITPYDCAVALIPVSKPADAIDQVVSYKRDVIGLANSSEVPTIASLASNGITLLAGATRGVTDIFPLFGGLNYTIYVTVNGSRGEALVIYYDASDVEISRGTFVSTDLQLTPPNNAAAFRVYIRKNNSNASFVYTDDVQIHFVPNQKPLAEVVSYVRDMFERYTGEPYLVDMEQGAFTAEGLNEAATTRMRSTRFIPVSYLDNFTVSLISNVSGASFQYIVLYYADNYYGTPQLMRTGTWLNSDTVQFVPENARYIRLYVKNVAGVTISPDDVQVKIRVKKSSININTVRPLLSQIKLDAVAQKYKYQDIAVYNGDLFDFGEGIVSINGGPDISITNGHGNNCCFGTELHGDYPYLYCGSWNKDDCKVFVNQYQNGTFTLVRTIEYQTLSGYLNACVDEENEKIYIILNTSATTEEGAVDFIVSDMQGNILERKTIDNIPVIEGMTFYDDAIIVSSGHGIGYPSYVHIFDTKGNLLSKSTRMNVDWDSSTWNDTIEGIDVDKVTGNLYIGLTTLIFKT